MKLHLPCPLSTSRGGQETVHQSNILTVLECGDICTKQSYVHPPSATTNCTSSSTRPLPASAFRRKTWGHRR